MTDPILKVSDLSVYYNKKKALNNVSMDFYPNEKNIYKTYKTSSGDVPALRGVSLEVEKGMFYAIIGKSGSGKSTLLRSINRMGDLNPEVTLTGAIAYNGHNIYSPRTDTVELRKEIGMVFQQPNPFPMSIYQNVVYGLRLKGIKDKEIR